VAAVVALTLVLGLPLATPSRAYSDALPLVLGKTYGEWSAKWWQWAAKEPPETNPLLDTTGAYAGLNQEGRVWFLAGYVGTTTGPIVRDVNVPIGRNIFFPIVNFGDVNGNSAIPIETEEQGRTYLDSFIKLFSNLVCTLDDVPVVFNPKTPIVRTQSPTFDITVITDNIFGLPEGDYPLSWSDGYWVMLPPLTPGEHVLHFYAHVDSGPFPNFTQDITYNLTVE